MRRWEEVNQLDNLPRDHAYRFQLAGTIADFLLSTSVETLGAPSVPGSSYLRLYLSLTCYPSLVSGSFETYERTIICQPYNLRRTGTRCYG